MKNLIKNLFFNYNNKYKKKNLFFNIIKLKNFFEKNIKENNINISIKVDKIFKHKIRNKLKINFSYSIFNYYKRYILFKLMKYLSFFYKIKIKKGSIYF